MSNINFLKDLKVSIIEWQVDWLDIKNLCRKTANLDDSIKEPLDTWKKKLLIAEHSPLRHSLITVQIDNIPYAMMGHLVRHSVGVTPYVTTSRTDRTGIPREERSQMDLVSMRIDLNIQSLINISRKRLCNQADILTKRIWLEVVKEVSKYDEQVAWACVPEGIRTCGCPEEFGNCCACENIIKNMGFEERLDLIKRYDYYNEQKNKQLELIRK